MKRIAALLLALVMVGALCACGTGAKPAESTESQTTTTGEKKVLRVAMECGYAPYNWAQPDNSNGAVPIADSSDFAYGYDVMMAKRIAEKLGYELQIVQLPWDSLIPALQSGQVDAVIAGQSVTKDRLEVVDFSVPYYYASFVALTMNNSKYANAAGMSELKGATCTSQLGTVWYDKGLPQIPEANILPAQESAPAMLVALQSGSVDVVVTDMPTAKGAVSVYKDMKLLDFNSTQDNFVVSDEDVNIGISVKKGNKELLDGINSVLSTMTKDDFNKMMDEAIAVQPLTK